LQLLLWPLAVRKKKHQLLHQHLLQLLHQHLLLLLTLRLLLPLLLHQLTLPPPPLPLLPLHLLPRSNS
jgi:hypothetical protein